MASRTAPKLATRSDIRKAAHPYPKCIRSSKMGEAAFAKRTLQIEQALDIEYFRAKSTGNSLQNYVGESTGASTEDPRRLHSIPAHREVRKLTGNLAHVPGGAAVLCFQS